MAKSKLSKIPISSIRENPVALRSVNRESVEYLGLVAAIKEKDFVGTIIVRPKTDEETQEKFYEIVDGLHRFSAAKDAGLTEIPVDIRTLDDANALELQIVGNMHRIETRPVEYSKQIRRLLAMNPLMTMAELAQKLSCSHQWLQQRLSLSKIDDEGIVKLIDNGKIILSNAYALAKLPTEEMANFIADAQTEGPDVFCPKVNARVKELREAKRAGRDAEPVEWQPTPFMRKIREVKDEFEGHNIGQSLIRDLQIKTPEEGFKLAIQWILHMDPQSVEVQRKKDEEKAKAREDAKQKRAAERAAKKKKDAEDKLKQAAADEAKILESNKSK